MTLKKRKIIDGHVHYAHYSYQDSLDGNYGWRRDWETGSRLCTPDEARLSLVPDAMMLKAAFPERVYVFGGAGYLTSFHHLRILPEKPLRIMWSVLLGMGVDGIKMIEGKGADAENAADSRFRCSGVCALLGKDGGHTNTVDLSCQRPGRILGCGESPGLGAREMGWFYGDGTFINNEAQYTQILNVLEPPPQPECDFCPFSSSSPHSWIGWPDIWTVSRTCTWI